LNTIRAESLNVSVIKESDTPQVDDPQVGCGLLQDLDVEHLVDLAFLLLGLFVCAVDVKHLETVDKTGSISNNISTAKTCILNVTQKKK
jgi:hypothetical protein